MFIKIILNIKHRAAFRVTVYALIFSFLLSVTGCYTTGNYRYENDNLPQDNDYEITKVVMKDGKTINLKGKSPYFVKEYNGKRNLIYYTDYDTMRVPVGRLNKPISIFKAKDWQGKRDIASDANNPSPVGEIRARDANEILESDSSETAKDKTFEKDTLIEYPTIKIIELDSVKSVTVQEDKFDAGKTFLLIAAIITVVFILLILAESSSDDNSKSDDKNKTDDDYDTYHEDDKEDNNGKNTQKKRNEGCEIWNLSPADMSMNIPRNVMLQWAYHYSEDSNLTFDILADTKNPPEEFAAKDIQGKKFELGIINPDTKIYWQLIAKDNGNVIARSPVWNFTTGK
jgi:hypothetical protein